jgi:FMN phosphatase YigB (HAD superfamily)
MSMRKKYNGKDFGCGDDLLYSLAKDLSQRSLNQSPDVMLSWITNYFYPTFIKVMPYMKGSRPGLINMLAELRNKGYKLAVLSDFAYIKERLRGLNIPSNLFDTLLSTESEGMLKPCTGPFLKIKESWHMESAEIVVVGDKDDTDGVGASEAGMPFIKISDKGELSDNSSDWLTIKDGLLSLPSLVK